VDTGVKDKYWRAFQEFVSKYGRDYRNTSEEQRRFAIYVENVRFIESQNAQNHTYKLAVNEFTDQNRSEFQSSRLGLGPPQQKQQSAGLPFFGLDFHRGTTASLPLSIDWVSKGAVNTPRNQGSCGSCWSFAATGALEAAWFLATGKLVSLSEQQLLDCSTENGACSGGDMDAAFDFLKNQSACTDESYPYKAEGATCQASNCTSGIPQGSVVGYYNVPVDDTDALMEAVAQQPVAVAIEADQSIFQSYNSGILTHACGDKIDHGVLLVGYGSENGTDYWKIKNSWGPTWGENGYIRLKRGLPRAGECGIKSRASYPIVLRPSIIV